MKLKLLFASVVAALLCASNFSAQALSLGTNSVDLSTTTNWAAIPFGIYRTDTKAWGYGGAVLYKVTDNFWTGARINSIGGQQVTAGVQAQLQLDEVIAGIHVTPFAETSVGLGNNSLYGSAGAGALIQVYDWNFHISGHPFELNFGIIGDYEHVVNGSGISWNQICGGPLVKLTF